MILQIDKLSPAVPPMMTKPMSLVAPNKATFPPTNKSTPKVIEPSHVTQPKTKNNSNVLLEQW